MSPETLEKLKRLFSYNRMYHTHSRNVEYVERDSPAVLNALLDELIAHIEQAPGKSLGYCVDDILTEVWAKFH